MNELVKQQRAVKTDEEHLATLLGWRNRIEILRILAGRSTDLDDLVRIANTKITELVRQHEMRASHE